MGCDGGRGKIAAPRCRLRGSCRTPRRRGTSGSRSAASECGLLVLPGVSGSRCVAVAARSLLPRYPWRSKFTGENSVVYQDAVDRGAEYDGENLERDFRAVLDRVRPTLVLAPSPQDTHPDHRGAGILAWRAMVARNEPHNIRYWIVHGGRGWPKPRAYHPGLPETVAPRGVGMQWEQFALDVGAVNAKLKAVRSHSTQMKVMGRVMESHVRATEMYSRTPMPPRSACAHAEPCEFEQGTIVEESGL